MTYYGMVVGKHCINGHVTNHRVSGWCNDQVELPAIQRRRKVGVNFVMVRRTDPSNSDKQNGDGGGLVCASVVLCDAECLCVRACMCLLLSLVSQVALTIYAAVTLMIFAIFPDRSPVVMHQQCPAWSILSNPGTRLLLVCPFSACLGTIFPCISLFSIPLFRSMWPKNLIFLSDILFLNMFAAIYDNTILPRLVIIIIKIVCYI